MTAQHPLIQHLLKEQDALLEKIPEWKADPKRAQAEMAELRAGLVKHYGVDPSLVETFPHHHGVLVARDALKAKSLQAELDKMKAAEVARTKASQAEKASATDQQRHSDFKERMADVRRSPGGKQDRREMIADYVDGKR
jgi:uncharacterized membrane-anchored protein YhcB (DUF1043 family)